ncbi:MAG: hypothetical protein LBF79_03650, partial [Dysgonamonadaceae bacterium]|nr:hypothetical protein [Dysgonamonadaceae bacterium]
GGVASTAWSTTIYGETDPKKIGGYAIYETDVWNVAVSEGGYFHPTGGSLDRTKPLYTDDAPEPLLFLPAAGFLFNTYEWLTSLSVSIPGYYWSSSVYNTDSYYLGFTCKAASSSNSDGRAYGQSIRCVSE